MALDKAALDATALCVYTARALADVMSVEASDTAAELGYLCPFAMGEDCDEASGTSSVKDSSKASCDGVIVTDSCMSSCLVLSTLELK